MPGSLAEPTKPTSILPLLKRATLGIVERLQPQDKLTIVTSDSLKAFPAWWEQLLAESTGKQDTGTVPVPEASLRSPDAYGDDRLFLVYQLEGDPAVAGVEALEEAGFPTRVIHLLQREEIASEMYRAEFAVVVQMSYPAPPRTFSSRWSASIRSLPLPP